MKIELSSYNSEQDEEANNKLTIEDDLSKMNNEKNIQINELHHHSIILTPQEQFKNFPNYRFFTKFGILFCKIGNILACNFDKDNNNSPKICIGPHWYLSIVSNILITVLLIKCQVFYNPDKKVEHCKMCNVCIEKLDHHCVWVGKCVGKNNIISFYAMLISIGLVYGFIIYLAFFQYSNKVSKKIKTK